MSITLKLPFWISPPAQVTQQNLIEQVVTNMYEGMNEDDVDADNLLQRDITTPGNHAIEVTGGKIKLLGSEGSEVDSSGVTFKWAPLLDVYGQMRPTVSQLRLKTNPNLDDDTGDIIGTIQFDSANSNELFWQVDLDTLPGNTLQPVDAVIDPLRSFPVGGGLPAPAPLRRYLLLNDIGPSQAWGDLTARANDVIEFRSGSWVVAFASVGATDVEYLLNLHTGRQLRWNGYDWGLTIDGQYPAGYWRLSL